jgi:hypothetical protein
MYQSYRNHRTKNLQLALAWAGYRKHESLSPLTLLHAECIRATGTTGPVTLNCHLPILGAFGYRNPGSSPLDLIYKHSASAIAIAIAATGSTNTAHLTSPFNLLKL